PGDRAQARLRELLVLYPAFHSLAVLRLRLCVRRLPGELALCGLRECGGGLCRALSRHARGRRHQRPCRTVGAVRARCARPDLLPPEYAAELQKLQSEAPPMGWAFVKRRMMAELGAGWESKFSSFEHHPAAAASLGQVHRARSLDGKPLACKLQYPDMQSAVEADLQQLDWLLAIRRHLDRAIDTSEIA